ncbi:MAG: alanine--tRNA ligase [bacterium]
MKSKEIRERFLSYFSQRGHTVKESASLIPNDPNLLFTIAGMVTFKPLFLGRVNPIPFTRAASSQRCLRTNDIENVGYTARHHTFFEMLGNFSFGDYFKEEAILWGWEFLTKELSLPKERLWVSIYLDDEEAYSIWKKFIPEDRIICLGEESNFWKMGDTGPCGPCSEILYDQGPQVSCGKSNCGPSCDCDRFLELWNLVFTQYDRLDDGTLLSLPKKNIDTGMGLERLTAVIQKKLNNFETDLFMPIIEEISQLSKKTYGKDKKQDVAFKIISDHLRAITFLIFDGVIPTNEGRGYVLRSLIRRAIRQGKILNLPDLFLYKLVFMTIKTFSISFLSKEREDISKVVKTEEEKFSKTLDTGLKILEEIMINCEKKDLRIIPGDEVFKLYDTYGFPMDLTADIAKEHNLRINTEEFKRLMEEQKKKAKAAKVVEDDRVGKYISPQEVKFVGYENCKKIARVINIFKNKEEVREALKGDEVELILDVTPFYGESGGQIGDSGFIYNEKVRIKVEDTQKINSLIIHKGKVEEGQLKLDEKIFAEIDQLRRLKITKNHTTTHLLQAALRQVLGKHVKQSGSLVEDKRLRFDFTHPSSLTIRELERIERIVNEKIWENLLVETFEEEIEEAKEKGAIALFQEEYSKIVRVVKIGNFSLELCGGTHVKKTSEICLFKLITELAVAAGIRRIEGITEADAYQTTKLQEQSLSEISEKLKSKPEDLVSKIETLICKNRELEKENSSLMFKLFLTNLNDLLKQKEEMGGVSVISTLVKDVDINLLRQASDILVEKLPQGEKIVILAAIKEDKICWVCKVSENLTKKIHAGKLINEVAKITEGAGGGKADMGQAGGRDPSKISQAIKESKKMIAEMLKEKKE